MERKRTLKKTKNEEEEMEVERIKGDDKEEKRKIGGSKIKRNEMKRKRGKGRREKRRKEKGAMK